MTLQSKTWASEFGTDYTDRNNMTIEKMDAMYLKQYGITRSKMNEQFLGHYDRNIHILEVGANVGLQLQYLQQMGFVNLYGIEISEYAVEMSKKLTKNINIIHANALNIPFKDGYFDLVFTSGVLIHIAEKDLSDVMREIYRCSNYGIWGFEYYSEKRKEINYRGNNDLLWKDNFMKRYLDLFPYLTIVKTELYPFIGTDYQDHMFLLRK